MLERGESGKVRVTDDDVSLPGSEGPLYVLVCGVDVTRGPLGGRDRGDAVGRKLKCESGVGQAKAGGGGDGGGGSGDVATSSLGKPKAGCRAGRLKRRPEESGDVSTKE